LHRAGFQKKVPILLTVLVFFVLLAAFLSFIDKRAAPQIALLAQTAAKQQATLSIHQTVEDVLIHEKVTYETLVRVVADPETAVRTLQTDAAAVTLLEGKINQAIEKTIGKKDAVIKLPLGALLGSELFAGAGPNIKVRLNMTAHVQSDIRSDVVSSGLNQTMHRILMPLEVELNVILPHEILKTSVSTVVCLADTVLIGAVPGGLLTGRTE
jgi:sporulation protein YunB